MAEKVIKKIVSLTVINEDWSVHPDVRTGQLSFTVKGEVKNTGLSEIKNGIVIAALVNSKSGKTYQLLSKKFSIYKAADYTILPAVAPGKSVNFEVSIGFPAANTLAFGKKSLNIIEDKIRNEKIAQKVFLIYDRNILDDTTQEWFREELLSNLRFIQPKWEVVYNEDGNAYGIKSMGIIKNSGAKVISEFAVYGAIYDQKGNVLAFSDFEESIEIAGKFEIEKLETDSLKKFELVCYFPSEEVLEENNWSSQKLEENFIEGEIKGRLLVNFVDNERIKMVYRDTDDTASIITELEGEKQIESFDENWEDKTARNEFVITGTVRNTGNVDADDIYVIASLVKKDSNEPIKWETATDTYKAVTIEKITYLKKGDVKNYSITLKKPSGKSEGKEKWNPKKLEEMIRKEQVIKKVELYYHKEDVYEEGIKRLRLGNSYFQLKNFRACAGEYIEGAKLIPDEKMFYFNLGLCFYKLGDIDKAVDYCKKATFIDDKYSKGNYLMGLLYQSLQRYDDAIDMYKSALKTDESDFKISYNIGCVNILKKNIPEGIKWLKAAMQKDKNAVLTQIVKDQDLRNARNNTEYNEFITELRQGKTE